MNEYNGICNKCKKEFTLKRYGINNRNRNNQGFDLCTTCLLSNIRKQSYGNMTDEQKKSRGDKISMTRINKSIEEKELIKNKTINSWNVNREKNIENIINGHLNMSEDAKRAAYLKIAESKKKWWESLMEEDLALIKNNASKRELERLKNMNSDEMIEYKERLHKIWTDDKRSIESLKQKDIWDDEKRKIHSDMIKEYYIKLSKDDKIRLYKHLEQIRADYNKSMDGEEFNRWAYNLACGIAKSNLKGPTETQFANDLLIYNIQYEWGFASTIIHKEFTTLFRVNPITNGKVSPYHAWDFKVGNVLIDLDGSEHILDFNIKHKNGMTVNTNDLIKFNDSKRPYQNDNMDWYVIQCYDDKLVDDTNVLVGKSGKYITYKDLLTILKFDTIKKEG